MKTVVVTPRSAFGHRSLQRIEEKGYKVVVPTPGRQPTEEDLVNAMAECVGYLAGVEPVTKRVIDAADKLKVISRNGVGVDNVDLQAAESKNIVVARATGANARGVAELAVGHMIAAARDLCGSCHSVKDGGWERSRGIELNARQLGLLGCGSIGQRVAEIALGIGMSVRAYDPFPPNNFKPSGDFELADFQAVLSSSDVISLHCPPSPDGFVIGEAEIEQLKDGAILINTARDGLIDSVAAARALDTGKLRAVTVDAFAQEPPTDLSFVSNPKVIATPHIGGFTKESVDIALDMAVSNILDVLEQ